MSDQFIAEIRIFPFNFAPFGWAFCDGQLLTISQNTAVFSLIGTFYGGNGTSNFGLPNLQGSAPLMNGQGTGLTQRDIGESGGEQTVTLTINEMPVHTHSVTGVSGNGDQTSPAANAWATAHSGPKTKDHNYASSTNGSMSPAALATAGGNQPHNNLMPYLVLNFCIALTGIFPARS